MSLVLLFQVKQKLIEGILRHLDENPSAWMPVLQSLTATLTSRLFTLHTFAAQAYVTYLTVAGQVIHGMAAAIDTSEVAPTPPSESGSPIEPMTGKTYSCFSG